MIRNLIIVALALSLSACATNSLKMARPEQIAAPQPIGDNSGAYMNPYTEDGVLAQWVDKAINAKLGASAGGALGSYAGQKAMENAPFVGGMLGQAFGENLGREVAIQSAGGWESIKGSSDSSFNSVDDLAVYLYARHSGDKHYQEALEATMEIYPDLRQHYMAAVLEASR